MFKFESVETKSNEFCVAYAKLLSVIRGRMAMDTAFAENVRQAVAQFNDVYATNLNMYVSTCLLPRHCYQLGRYSNPELYSSEYVFGALPSGLYDVHVLTYTIYKTVVATLNSLIYITVEEDPIRWFTPLSKCCYWESFSTAILGVPEWEADEPLWKLQPYPCEEVGRALTVGISSDVRGFLYPILALNSLLVQVRKLQGPAVIKPRLKSADGIEDYLNVLQSLSVSLTAARDDTANLIKHLVED